MRGLGFVCFCFLFLLFVCCLFCFALFFVFVLFCFVLFCFWFCFWFLLSIYVFHKQPIERVSCVKFLCTWISSNLSWNDQIDHICKKARKTIGYLHRSFHSAPPQTRRSLYLALVRPILEYGCTTYHPLNSKLTNRLETTQRFACRVILQDWKLTHDDLLLEADLQLLSKGRDFATLC